MKCEKIPIQVIDAIKARHSVRTFQDKELSSSDREKLVGFMNALTNPFGIPVKKYIIDKKVAVTGEKLGTYGVIKGARTFLGVSIPDVDMAHVAAGYEFENLILEATSMGLGTVWLAATFNREGFAAAMRIPDDELLPTIAPVGYPAAKRRMAESLMRAAMHSSARKEWASLFYNGDFRVPLTKTVAGVYAEPLEMLRLAPSDKNSQPWRILRSDHAYHFYVTYKAGISREEKIIKRVDLGIALSHFHQTALELGLKGSFVSVPPADSELPDHVHYIISWQMENS